MNYAKLNKKFDCPDYELGKLATRYGNLVREVFYGIQYDEVHTDHAYKFYSVIPQEFRKDFTLLFFSVNTVGALNPHTDYNILCCINFYMSTNREKTQFYSVKPGAQINRTSPEIPRQRISETSGSSYRWSDLEELDSFIAESGEAFLLNVAVPHSVLHTRINEKRRQAFTLSTAKHDFNSVLEMLKQTQCI